MDYFYTPPHLVARDLLVIEGDEFTHLTHVMRKNVGDTLRVVDGTGIAYDAVVTSLEKRAARCKIHEKYVRLNEPEIDMTLAVGLLKNAAKFDFLIEKTTELGVSSVIPLLTERTIPRHARVERWEKLALAAMKQSCRCMVPKVCPPMTFTNFVLATHESSLRVIFHGKANMPFHALTPDRTQHQQVPAVTICIGPEGGFSDDEVELATTAGFIPVNLGTRRLRTETAAIVSIAALMLWRSG